jgi:hypothetical protein
VTGTGVLVALVSVLLLVPAVVLIRLLWREGPGRPHANDAFVRALPVATAGLPVLGLLAAPVVGDDGENRIGLLYGLVFIGVCAAWLILSATTYLLGRPRALVPPALRERDGAGANG